MDLISEYRVMQSAAGYYVGTAYYDTDIGDAAGYWLPYDRVSMYYGTSEMALDDLRGMVLRLETDGDDEYILTRLYFEDNISFWHNLEEFS